MDDSENSRFDHGDDEDGQDAPSIPDGPVAVGWASDADSAPADTVFGAGSGTSAEGHEDDRWGRQSQDGLQLPVAAAMVISEFLGDSFDVRDEAGLIAAGEPGASEGMSLEGGAALLDHYGIEAHVEHGDLSTLDRYLQEGRSIIVAVDADELYGLDDDSSTADRTADHALVILGIDDDAGVAILQDPRNPEGQGYEVSIDALEDAWADSGNGMVVTDRAAPDLIEARAAERVEGTTLPSVEHGAQANVQAARIRAWGPAGAVILPILLGGRALIRRRTRA